MLSTSGVETFHLRAASCELRLCTALLGMPMQYAHMNNHVETPGTTHSHTLCPCVWLLLYRSISRLSQTNDGTKRAAQITHSDTAVWRAAVEVLTQLTGRCAPHRAVESGLLLLARMGETTSIASCDCSCAGAVLMCEATTDSLEHRSRPCWMCRLNNSIWNLILRTALGAGLSGLQCRAERASLAHGHGALFEQILLLCPLLF